MKLWIDTEFNEYRGALISLALVAEDGREWYGVRFCDDPGWWVMEHVMPVLGQVPERDAALRSTLATFLAQFDSVHIISDWPGDIAHFCNFLEYAPGERIGPDSMTFEVRRDLPDTSTTSSIPHNALEDARALRNNLVVVRSGEIKKEKSCKGLLREALAWIESSQKPAFSLCENIRKALGMEARQR